MAYFSEKTMLIVSNFVLIRPFEITAFEKLLKNTSSKEYN